MKSLYLILWSFCYKDGSYNRECKLKWKYPITTVNENSLRLLRIIRETGFGVKILCFLLFDNPMY